MMIGLSILKDNIGDSPRSFLRMAVTIVQRVVFPLAVIGAMVGMIAYGQLPGGALLFEAAAEMLGLAPA